MSTNDNSRFSGGEPEVLGLIPSADAEHRTPSRTGALATEVAEQSKWMTEEVSLLQGSFKTITTRMCVSIHTALI